MHFRLTVNILCTHFLLLFNIYLVQQLFCRLVYANMCNISLPYNSNVNKMHINIRSINKHHFTQICNTSLLLISIILEFKVIRLETWWMIVLFIRMWCLSGWNGVSLILSKCHVIWLMSRGLIFLFNMSLCCKCLYIFILLIAFTILEHPLNSYVKWHGL